MAKYFYDYEDLERKWMEASKSARISSESSQNAENIPKSEAKTAKMVELLEKQRAFDRKMEKIARFKYFYGSSMPDKFRGLSDEQLAKKLDDLGPAQLDSFAAKSHGLLSGLQYDEPPPFTLMKRTDPNAVFKRHKQKAKEKKVLSIFDEILDEHEMKKALKDG